MSTSNLKSKILKLIPSQTLKDYLKVNRFRFTEKDLLKFIDEYAPTFSAKLELFDQAAKNFIDKKTASHARKLIGYYQNEYERFTAADDDYVYEVEIRCNPNDTDDTYIVKSYDDALAVIKSFLKFYKDCGAVDNKLSKYTIIKKTAFPPKKPRDIFCKVGEVGRCVLGYKLVLLSVEMHSGGSEFGKCKPSCQDCKKECIGFYSPHFPPFLEKYDLVAFESDWSYSQNHCEDDVYNCRNSGKYVVYGILITDMTEYDYDSYVVLLDNRYIRNRDAFYQDDEGYYRIYDAHEHPSYATLYKPDLTKVDEMILKDYAYAVDALKKLDQIEYDN